MSDSNTTVPTAKPARIRKVVDNSKAMDAKAKRAAARKKSTEREGPLPAGAVALPALTAARIAYAGASKRNEDALVTYAQQLNETLGVGWYDIPMAGPASDNELKARVGIKAENTAFLASAKDKGHSNPTVAWKQMKARARKLANPSAGPREKRSYKARFNDDVLAVWRKGFSEYETLSEAQREGNALLEKALRLVLGANLIETEKAKLAEKG